MCKELLSNRKIFQSYYMSTFVSNWIEGTFNRSLSTVIALSFSQFIRKKVTASIIKFLKGCKNLSSKSQSSLQRKEGSSDVDRQYQKILHYSFNTYIELFDFDNCVWMLQSEKVIAVIVD